MADEARNVSQPKGYKLIVEKDVRIPLRDGAILYADIFRPEGGAERFPAIMNIGPYHTIGGRSLGLAASCQYGRANLRRTGRLAGER